MCAFFNVAMVFIVRANFVDFCGVCAQLADIAFLTHVKIPELIFIPCLGLILALCVLKPIR